MLEQAKQQGKEILLPVDHVCAAEFCAEAEASTHEGEDELLLDAHAALCQRLPGVLLVLVPRHPERFDRVLLETLGELWPAIEERFDGNSAAAVRAMPYMDARYAAKMRARCSSIIRSLMMAR